MATVGTLRSPSVARQRWFMLALLLFFVGLSIHYSFKAAQGRGAISRWREQILQVDDEDIYRRYNYPNPPIMALLLRPLAELPPLVGALAWFYLKVGMTLLALHWTFRLVEAGGRPFPPWAKALTVLLSLRPIMGDLSHGNVNLFILFLVVAALYAFHQRRDLLCGVLLGLAIACKVTPALFVPYLLWKRAWKALLGCVAGLGLFFFLVPAGFLGWDENATQLRSWVDGMVKPFVVQGVVTPEHNNQSLPGLVQRLATHSPSFSTYVNDVYTPTEYHNLLDLDPALARWLVKGFLFGFVLLVVWTCRTPTAPRENGRLAAEFAVVLLGMLLFSERTWKHHGVTLVVPFAVLCYHLATATPGPGFRTYLIGTLVIVALLMASTSTSLLAWERAAKLAQVYGAYVWAYLLLLGALIAVLRRSSAPIPSALPNSTTAE